MGQGIETLIRLGPEAQGVPECGPSERVEGSYVLIKVTRQGLAKEASRREISLLARTGNSSCLKGTKLGNLNRTLVEPVGGMSATSYEEGKCLVVVKGVHGIPLWRI